MRNDKKITAIVYLVIMLTASLAHAEDISGDGWRLWLDKKASWEKDKLYLPEESADLNKLPPENEPLENTV